MENVKPLCDDDGRRSITDRNVLVQPASPANDPNLSAELEMHLQNAESGGGREGREGEREKLIKEREELLDRMKEKVRILREDEQEVEADMQAVRMEGERLVGLVEEQSSFVEGDKVCIHLKKKVKEKKTIFYSRCASTCRRWRDLSLSCEFSRRDLRGLRRCFSGHRKPIKRFVFM